LRCRIVSKDIVYNNFPWPEAHQKLDKAVDAAYGIKTAKSDAERVAFLFGLYQKYTSLFPAPEAKRRARAGTKTKLAARGGSPTARR